MRLKASEWKKVTYSLICVFMFFVHAKKKIIIIIKKMKSPTVEMC